MTTAVSVIVPTLNEAGRLAHLLEALRMQTLPPQEVIVADAGSSDGTAELAHRAGCRVVEGGRPAVGRNYGAAAATCDVLLFLDADVVPSADFIERALDEFGATGASAATAAFEPLEAGRLNSFIAMGVNQFLRVTQSFSPHAPGFCILARRDSHESVGGFDETLALAEDHDYVRRLARHGKFRVLTSVSIAVSMRRIEEEGVVPLGLKYTWCEACVLAGVPIRSVPFRYRFGVHAPPAQKR
jgi:glycosyltransferase involved in cell wall biosynthesis